MRRIALFAAAAALLVSGFPAAGSASETAPGEAHGFIPVSSGVELRYSVKTPSSRGPFPTIFLTTPTTPAPPWRRRWSVTGASSCRAATRSSE